MKDTMQLKIWKDDRERFLAFGRAGENFADIFSRILSMAEKYKNEGMK